MIIVLMRHRHDVKLSNAAFPKVRRYDLLTDIHAPHRISAEAREPATVYKHCLPVGQRDQKAVALSDIDGRELQPPGNGIAMVHVHLKSDRSGKQSRT